MDLLYFMTILHIPQCEKLHCSKQWNNIKKTWNIVKQCTFSAHFTLKENVKYTDQIDPKMELLLCWNEFWITVAMPNSSYITPLLQKWGLLGKIWYKYIWYIAQHIKLSDTFPLNCINLHSFMFTIKNNNYSLNPSAHFRKCWMN